MSSLQVPKFSGSTRLKALQTRPRYPTIARPLSLSRTLPHQTQTRGRHPYLGAIPELGGGEKVWSCNGAAAGGTAAAAVGGGGASGAAGEEDSPAAAPLPPEEAAIPPPAPRSFCCPLGCNPQNKKKASSRQASTPAYTRKAPAVPKLLLRLPPMREPSDCPIPPYVALSRPSCSDMVGILGLGCHHGTHLYAHKSVQNIGCNTLVLHSP